MLVIWCGFAAVMLKVLCKASVYQLERVLFDRYEFNKRVGIYAICIDDLL